jgi:uroporphyrin-III C-methyltransferase / precorrin-2 dehydrogenase / sirohydrochlorin ferrochelatase
MSEHLRTDASSFPVFLRLDRRGVLVVGGGDEAVAKVRLLSPTRAAIIVVTPEPCDALIALAAEERIELRHREFDPAELKGVRLCIIAVPDEHAARSVADPAAAADVLVNVVDRPSLSDFTVPAIVDRSPVTVAIGTEGTAPCLARDLRSPIEAALPPGVAVLGALCGDWRARVIAALPDRAQRRRFWDAAMQGPEAQAALDGKRTEAEALIAMRLNTACAGHNQPAPGSAALVGAGPGDPELLTLRAVRALKRADVVMYDALIDPVILDLARRDARRIDVGKRCGRHAMSQAAINRLILQLAQSGAHVVRLKGGDPMVFGRGGEELDCLRAAGVPVEVIPGVTAACAAAARLAIPLTHRHVARSLHLITGHGADGSVPAHDWAGLARAGGTIAAYMAARTLSTVAAQLIAAGLPPATPSVAVQNASRSNERHLFAPLAELPSLLSGQGFDGPTLGLIGTVVELAVKQTTELARAA